MLGQHYRIQAKKHESPTLTLEQVFEFFVQMKDIKGKHSKEKRLELLTALEKQMVNRNELIYLLQILLDKVKLKFGLSSFLKAFGSCIYQSKLFNPCTT